MSCKGHRGSCKRGTVFRDKFSDRQLNDPTAPLLENNDPRQHAATFYASVNAIDNVQ